MPLSKIRAKLRDKNLSPMFGTITKISSTTIEAQGLRPSIGDIVKMIALDGSKSELGMVTEVDRNAFLLLLLDLLKGLK